MMYSEFLFFDCSSSSCKFFEVCVLGCVFCLDCFFGFFSCGCVVGEAFFNIVVVQKPELCKCRMLKQAGCSKTEEHN